MQNLLLARFERQKQVPIQVPIIYLNRDDYLRVIAGKLVKIPPQTTIKCGAKYKLVCGDNYTHCYLYCVVDDHGYFTKTL